jgi:acylphosphatase
MSTAELFISGRVQRVGFRACVKRIALNLSVTGTVKNLPDGRVHIIATAESIILEKFVSMLYGCPRAVIRDIQIREIEPQSPQDFSILKINIQ